MSDDLRNLSACLDDLLSSRFHSNWTIDRIGSCNDLPSRLCRRMTNLPPNLEWRAYRDEARVSCAIARAHIRTSPLTDTRQPCAAMDVFFLDEDAAVYSAAVWEHDRRHGWWLDSVLDASYDCDSGWWFEALLNPLAETNLAPYVLGSRRTARKLIGSK